MHFTWTHPSIAELLKNRGDKDPVEVIKEEARNLALRAFRLGWNGPPYDPVDLARILRINVTPNESISDARILPFGNNSFQIEYNPFQNLRRTNFSLAHEIVHTFFPDCNQKIRNREPYGSQDWQLELLCNIGAAEILLPYGEFSSDLNNKPINLDTVKFLADKYKVSLESVLLRLCEVADKLCIFAIATFVDKGQRVLRVDYSKASRESNLMLEGGMEIPKSSKVYECLNSGWTAYSTENWEIFSGESLMVYGIGLPPLKNSEKGRVGILITSKDQKSVRNNQLYTVVGDATKPVSDGTKIIAQVVNTMGAMGAGFGKAMAQTWPESAKNIYKWRLRKNEFKLGGTSLIKLSDDIYAFQMIAQSGINYKAGATIPLRYDILRGSLIEMADKALELNASIHMPLIGAGQAGGDWGVIEGMIKEEVINRGVDVKVYVLHHNQIPKKQKVELTLFD